MEQLNKLQVVNLILQTLVNEFIRDQERGNYLADTIPLLSSDLVWLSNILISWFFNASPSQLR